MTPFRLPVLLRQPGSIVAMIALAVVGAGAATTWNTVVPLLLRGPSIAAADRIVLTDASKRLAAAAASGDMKSLEAFSVYSSGFVALDLGQMAVKVPATEVGPTFWKVIVPQGSAPAAAPFEGPAVAIASSLAGRLDREPRSLLGRRLTINGLPLTVDRIVADEAAFPRGTLVWAPADTFGPAFTRGALAGHGIGRLRSGATIAACQVELQAIRSTTRAPARPIPIASLTDEYVTPADRRRAMGAVAVWSVLSAMAVGNAFFVVVNHAFQRRREIAIRVALGASALHERAVLARDSALLFFASGLAAAGVAHIISARWSGIANTLRTLPSPTTLNQLAVVGTFLAIGLAVGSLAAALSLPRISSADVLRIGRGLTHGVSARTRQMVLVGQMIAVTVGGLLAADLWSRNAALLSRHNLGMNPDRVSVAEIILEPGKESMMPTTVQTLLDGITAVPGVTAAGAVNELPGAVGRGVALLLTTTEHPDPVIADMRIATPGYFTSLGVEMVEAPSAVYAGGRWLDNEIVVGDRVAAQLWPGRTAIGQVVSIRGLPGGPWHVAAVVRSPRPEPTRATTPEVYFRLGQFNAGAVNIAVHADRQAVATAALVGAIRTAGLSTSATPTTMTDILRGSVEQRVVDQTVAIALALTALIVTLLGAIATAESDMQAHIRAYTIRRVLGAQRWMIALRHVSRNGVGIGAGCIVGLIVWLFVGTRVLRAVYGEPQISVLMSVEVALLLGLVHVAASVVPLHGRLQETAFNELKNE